MPFQDDSIDVTIPKQNSKYYNRDISLIKYALASGSLREIDWDNVAVDLRKSIKRFFAGCDLLNGHAKCLLYNIEENIDRKMLKEKKTMADILSARTVVIDDDYLLNQKVDLFVVHAYGIALLGIPSATMCEKVMTRMKATTNIDLTPEAGFSTKIVEVAIP
jgi:hypothetical protein